jgi:hypothetical protein
MPGGNCHIKENLRRRSIRADEPRKSSIKRLLFDEVSRFDENGKSGGKLAFLTVRLSELTLNS